jgi:hypothetical protein
MAKFAREQRVKERRALKQEKKQAAAAERNARNSDRTPAPSAVEDETDTA